MLIVYSTTDPEKFHGCGGDFEHARQSGRGRLEIRAFTVIAVVTVHLSRHSLSLIFTKYCLLPILQAVLYGTEHSGR